LLTLTNSVVLTSKTKRKYQISPLKTTAKQPHFIASLCLEVTGRVSVRTSTFVSRKIPYYPVSPVLFGKCVERVIVDSEIRNVSKEAVFICGSKPQPRPNLRYTSKLHLYQIRCSCSFVCLSVFNSQLFFFFSSSLNFSA